MARLNIAFICQSVDLTDPIQATTVRWIRVLSEHQSVNKLSVIALRVGKYQLPNNVEIQKIGGKNRLLTLFRFYLHITRKLIRKEIDCFFIYQGGTYPILLLPFRLLLKKNVYQWKAHPHISFMMRFYARYCDTLVFTSTAQAFPVDIPKIRIVGQGVDTERFCFRNQNRDQDIVIVGRVSPVKRLDLAINLIARFREIHGSTPKVNIYGPTSENDEDYRKSLSALIDKHGLTGIILFKGPVYQEILPNIFNSHKLLINFSETALDRAVVEAMSCGLPILSTNNCVKEIVPSSYKDILLADTEDCNMDCLAEKLYRHLSMSDSERNKLGDSLRNIIMAHHGDESLFNNIMKEILSHEK